MRSVRARHAVRGTPAVGAHSGIWRLLDANANRAREGLRVVEDTCRFVLNRPDAARAFREMRHSFDVLVREHYRTLVKNRSVHDDSGRTNRSKPYSGGVSQLLIANLKRCEEAMRVFEEYGRIVSTDAVCEAQRIRFALYSWEQRLL